MNKDPGDVQSSFERHVSLWTDTFARKYAERLPAGVPERVFGAPNSSAKLDALVAGLKGTGAKLYVIVDEYDNFTNTILAESGLGAYNDLCHGDGFFKQFFTILKTATSGTEAPVSRLFVTGVSPVTMDDVTSGFNIGTNISLDPTFADLTGFRHDDLRAISDYYGAQCGFDAGRLYETARIWYETTVLAARTRRRSRTRRSFSRFSATSGVRAGFREN